MLAQHDGFLVTILKPSTTYGPMQGMLRHIAWEFSWIDRIRQGKPIAVCGQGDALHQHLHVEDAARGFAQGPGSGAAPWTDVQPCRGRPSRGPRITAPPWRPWAVRSRSSG